MKIILLILSLVLIPFLVEAATLTWDRNTETNLDHYNVYLNGTKVTTVAQPPVGTTPTYPLPNTATGSYQVSAVNTYGLESGLSVSVPFTAPGIPTNPHITP